MGTDLGIKKVWAVANKVRDEKDREFILQELEDMEAVAFIPYTHEVIESGMGRGEIDKVLDGPVGEEIGRLRDRLDREFVSSG